MVRPINNSKVKLNSRSMQELLDEPSVSSEFVKEDEVKENSVSSDKDEVKATSVSSDKDEQQRQTSKDTQKQKAAANSRKTKKNQGMNYDKDEVKATSVSLDKDELQRQTSKETQKKRQLQIYLGCDHEKLPTLRLEDSRAWIISRADKCCEVCFTCIGTKAEGYYSCHLCNDYFVCKKCYGEAIKIYSTKRVRKTKSQN